MKNLKRIFSLMTAVFMAVILLVPAFAETIALDKNCSLTLNYIVDGKPIPDASFNIFYVANISANGDSFSPVGKFRDYPINWTFTDSEMMRDTAYTLAGYIARDGLIPSYGSLTDEDGAVSFPGEDGTMLPGLYLISGDRIYIDEDVVTVTPSLVTLPFYDEKTGEWSYDLTAIPKFDHDKAHSDTDTVNCSVLKVWEGDEKHPEARPKSVTVILLRDGELFDTKELNAENNWRYTWEKLSAKHYWVALEKETENYQVLVSRNETTFIIKNTYVPPVPPEETTSGEETTVPGETTTTPDDETTTRPDGETTTSPEGTTLPEETTTSTTPENTLPNTGMLWWPVTVFAVAGLLLFIMGWVMLRRYEYDNV